METTEKFVIYIKIFCQYCAFLLKFESLYNLFGKKINSMKKKHQKSNPLQTIPTQFFKIRYSKKNQNKYHNNNKK